MRIEILGPRRLRLILGSVPLELWLYLDPGHEPMAVWFDCETGQALAEVPCVEPERHPAAHPPEGVANE